LGEGVEHVRREHGGGVKLMRELLETVMIPSYSIRKVLGGISMEERDDGTAIPLGGSQLV